MIITTNCSYVIFVPDKGDAGKLASTYLSSLKNLLEHTGKIAGI